MLWVCSVFSVYRGIYTPFNLGSFALGSGFEEANERSPVQ